MPFCVRAGSTRGPAETGRSPQPERKRALEPGTDWRDLGSVSLSETSRAEEAACCGVLSPGCSGKARALEAGAREGDSAEPGGPKGPGAILCHVVMVARCP